MNDMSHVPVARRNTTKFEIAYNTDECEGQDDYDHVDQQREENKTARILKRFNVSTGWRRGVLYCIATGLFVLFCTVAFAGWAMTCVHSGKGIAIIFQGACSKSKIISATSHILINALSTLLLGASNYCMHILSAPLRRDIDRMHARKVVLDIGVNSVSNIFKLSWKTGILWCLLGLSSIPLHLIANSVVYASTTAYTYTAALVTPGFLDGDAWNTNNNPSLVWSGVSGSPQPPTSWLEQVQKGQLQLTSLDKTACIEAYDQFFVTRNANLLLVTEKNNSRVAECFDSSVLATYLGAYNYSDPNVERAYMSYNWLCRKDGEGAGMPRSCDSYLSGSLTFSQYVELDGTNYLPGCNRTSGQDSLIVNIDRCLTQQVEERCTVEGNMYLLSIVVVFITSKVIVMMWMLRFLREKPLAVLGDAIASFVTRPDSTTIGACLGPPQMFQQHGNWQGARKWKSRPRKWAAAASASQWFICLLLCSSAVGGAIALLANAVNLTPQGALPRSAFGTINPAFMMLNVVKGKGNSASSIVSAVLLANTPQLVVSFIYLSYNSVWTSMLMGLEWSQYAHKYHALRVSYPSGEQRSTYRLQIPYRYGVPLMILIGSIHWLISQSIFLIRIRVFSAEGVEDIDNGIVTCGYSLKALLTTIVVGGVAVLIMMAFGCRHYRPGMTLVKCNSAAISAACHTRSDEDEDEGAALEPLRWGAVPSTSDVGHCCFSKTEVSMPEKERMYA